MKSPEEQTDYTLKKLNQFMEEHTCPDCGGKRLNPQTLSCRINGHNIADLCEMEFRELREELLKITDPRGLTIVDQLVASLDRMIDIGLHASDIRQIMELLDSLIRRGNTVIVIEHNTDVMKLADYIIDIGPDGGTSGGEVVFTGTPREMMEQADTITARYLRK